MEAFVMFLVNWLFEEMGKCSILIVGKFLFVTFDKSRAGQQTTFRRPPSLDPASKDCLARCYCAGNYV